MTPNVTKKLSLLIEKIKAHQTAVGVEANRLRTPDLVGTFDKRSARSWCHSVMGDSLVRVRLLLEQNFNFVETLGLVAVARYLFELSVWLSLFEKDERYGLVYYGQLIETQHKYFWDNLEQISREIEMLRRFESKDKEAKDKALKIASPPEDLLNRLRSAAQRIDEEAARNFSLYAEQAKLNGYGFQASLVERKAKPPVEAALKELEVEQTYFNMNVIPQIEDLMFVNGKKKRWEWKKMAENVGLISEYSYIYTFASKLLHATPASITTNHKNLEPEEVLIFLRYIEIKVIDVLDFSRNYPRCTD